MPHYLNTQDPDFEDSFEKLLSLKREDAPDVNETVAKIISDVRSRGDEALIELTARFDGCELSAGTFAFTKKEIRPTTSWKRFSGIMPPSRTASSMATALQRA